MRVRVADRGVVLLMTAKATSRSEGRPRPERSQGEAQQGWAQNQEPLPGSARLGEGGGRKVAPVSPEEPDAGKPHVRICEGGGR